ncbi:MAG: hypothetical protein R2854_20945 [Caldilineaceae bacterium]
MYEFRSQDRLEIVAAGSDQSVDAPRLDPIQDCGRCATKPAVALTARLGDMAHVRGYTLDPAQATFARRHSGRHIAPPGGPDRQRRLHPLPATLRSGAGHGGAGGRRAGGWHQPHVELGRRRRDRGHRDADHRPTPRPASTRSTPASRPRRRRTRPSSTGRRAPPTTGSP